MVTIGGPTSVSGKIQNATTEQLQKLRELRPAFGITFPDIRDIQKMFGLYLGYTEIIALECCQNTHHTPLHVIVAMKLQPPLYKYPLLSILNQA